MDNFKNDLLRFRGVHGLTQAEAAEILETNTISIYRYESGRVTPFKAREIFFREKMRQYEQQKIPEKSTKNF